MKYLSIVSSLNPDTALVGTPEQIDFAEFSSRIEVGEILTITGIEMTEEEYGELLEDEDK